MRFRVRARGGERAFYGSSVGKARSRNVMRYIYVVFCVSARVFRRTTFLRFESPFPFFPLSRDCMGQAPARDTRGEFGGGPLCGPGLGPAGRRHEYGAVLARSQAQGPLPEKETTLLSSASTRARAGRSVFR